MVKALSRGRDTARGCYPEPGSADFLQMELGVLAGVHSVRLPSSDVEDAVQDAWVRGLAYFAVGGEPRSPKGWARQLGRRVALTIVRSARRRRRKFAGYSQERASRGPARSTGDPLLRHLLVEGLMNLTPARRDAFVGVHVLDFDAVEVARRWGVSPGTVRRYVWDARREMREFLVDRGIEGQAV